MATTFDGDIIVSGSLTVTGSLAATISPDDVSVRSLQVFGIRAENFRQHAAFATVLASTGSAANLGIIGGTFGTSTPALTTQDMNAAGSVTQYARTTFTLPHNYVAGQAAYLRVYGGMITLVASVAATVDVECYIFNNDTLVTGAGDISGTSAQSINSTTFAGKTFTLDPTNLVAGSVLDIRLTVTANSVTTSSHFARLSRIDALLVTR